MNATDTEAALLAAIRENPGEDAPRLVWADWLEENAGTVACAACKGEGKIGVGNNGNPYMATCDECHGTGRVSDGRAELAAFVRVQVELAARDDERCRCRECQPTGQHHNGPCRSPLKPLRTRERELWPAVRGRFAGDGVVCDIASGAQHAGTTLIIRRGLPAVVRCTLAGWMGGDCAACVGTGWTQASEPTSVMMPRCSQCQGKGEIPGIGPRLAQRWPVVAVEVTDKRQLGTNSTGGMRWTNESGQSWGLPEAIFERLPTGPTCTMIRDAGESWASRISARDYESEPAARAALSDAMLAWARSQPIEEGRS